MGLTSYHSFRVWASVDLPILHQFSKASSIDYLHRVYALKLIFLKCIFKFMINTAPPASNSAYGKEKWFWGNSWKLIFQNWLLCHCDALVKELLARADEPAGFDSRRRYFLFLCIAIIIFFLLFSICFSTLFFLLTCFPLFSLLTLLIIYFKLN